MADRTVVSAPAAQMEAPQCVRNTWRTPQAAHDAPTFAVLTTPNAQQQRALELVQRIRM
ncbi:MAG: hypothetical protein IT521_08395 [Burkholderiales bacterium]|nr:hypothetical protein [Burkholderiales bacterium]